MIDKPKMFDANSILAKAKEEQEKKALQEKEAAEKAEAERLRLEEEKRKKEEEKKKAEEERIRLEEEKKQKEHEEKLAKLSNEMTSLINDYKLMQKEKCRNTYVLIDAKEKGEKLLKSSKEIEDRPEYYELVSNLEAVKKLLSKALGRGDRIKAIVISIVLEVVLIGLVCVGLFVDPDKILGIVGCVLGVLGLIIGLGLAGLPGAIGGFVVGALIGLAVQAILASFIGRIILIVVWTIAVLIFLIKKIKDNS